MKLASLVVVLGGSLLVASSALAQDTAEPAVQPETGVTSAPASSETGAGTGRGDIKDNGPHQRPMMPSAHLYTPWRFGFGVGLKLAFEIPIVHNGFIPGINNSFSLEPNFSFAWNTYNNGYGYYGGSVYADDVNAMEYTPAISALWSFYFSPRFRAYAAFHVGVTILKPYWAGEGERDFDAEFESYVKAHIELAPGIVYMLGDRVGIRAELGWWSGAKFGVTVAL